MKRNGFTLVEMLVALALFSFLALAIVLLGGNATRTFFFSQSALAEVESLERMRALLAADLGQAAPRPSIGAQGGQLPAFTLLPDGFVLVRRNAPGTVPGLRKIAWGHVGRSWARQDFPAVDASLPGAATPLVHNVHQVRIRVADDNGWTESWQPGQPEALPRAVELTLVRGDGVPIILKFRVAA